MDINKLRLLAQAATVAITELRGRLEAAEKERDALRAELAQLRKEADKFGDGIDWIQRALQAEAKIEAMELQEPVSGRLAGLEALGWNDCRAKMLVAAQEVKP